MFRACIRDHSLGSIWLCFPIIFIPVLFTFYNQEIAWHVISPLWAQCCWISLHEDNVIHHNTSRTSCNTTAALQELLIYFLHRRPRHRNPAVSSKNKTRQHYFSGNPVGQSLAHWATTCQQDLSHLSPFPRPPLHLQIMTTEPCVRE